MPTTGLRVEDGSQFDNLLASRNRLNLSGVPAWLGPKAAALAHTIVPGRKRGKEDG